MHEHERAKKENDFIISLQPPFFPLPPLLNCPNAEYWTLIGAFVFSLFPLPALLTDNDGQDGNKKERVAGWGVEGTRERGVDSIAESAVCLRV